MTIKQLHWAESISNVMSGLIISILIVQPIVFWIYDIKLVLSDNIGIAIIFTLVSILRGYVWRHYFHNKFYEGK